MRGLAAGSGAPRGVARGWARADRGGGAAARCGLGWAAKALRKQLETSFECSLADYKDLIKEEIEAFSASLSTTDARWMILASIISICSVMLSCI